MTQEEMDFKERGSEVWVGWGVEVVVYAAPSIFVAGLSFVLCPVGIILGWWTWKWEPASVVWGLTLILTTLSAYDIYGGYRKRKEKELQ